MQHVPGVYREAKWKRHHSNEPVVQTVNLPFALLSTIN